MSSQLNVDTIVDKAGSGGTNVKVKGSNSTFVSEGGSVTQSLTKAIPKSFVGFDGGAGTIGDSITVSLNVSTLTDNGTGSYDATVTNNFSVGESCNLFTVGGTALDCVDGDLTVTNQYRFNTFNAAANLVDGRRVSGAVVGDLA